MSEDATLDEFVGKDEEQTDLQSTPTGNYASDWPVVRSGEYFSLQNGDFLKSDKRSDDAEYPVYGGNGIMGYTSDANVSAGKIVIGRVGAYCGNVHKTDSEAWITDNSIILTNDSEDFSNEYLRYLLTSVNLGQFSEQSAQPRISQSTVENLRIPNPPHLEQRKIATVLYTVDRAIEKTEEIIEQVERTKQALTQSLFLDGYFDHSETVDALHQNRLPHHPAEWQTKPAGEVMEVTRGAHPRPKSDDTLWRGEIPIVKIGDRNQGDSRTITSTDDTVTEKGSKKSKLVDEGTLIVSNAGTVGAARITGMQTCIHDHWLILRDYGESLSTRYLYYFINWNQEFLEALASGSTVLDLNTDDFRLFDVTFPSLEEQQKIADTLDSLHNRKMVNIEYSDRLKRLKRGLIQDLLSGTVRTTDTNIEVPEEIAQYG